MGTRTILWNESFKTTETILSLESFKNRWQSAEFSLILNYTCFCLLDPGQKLGTFANTEREKRLTSAFFWPHSLLPWIPFHHRTRDSRAQELNYLLWGWAPSAAGFRGLEQTHTGDSCRVQPGDTHTESRVSGMPSNGWLTAGPSGWGLLSYQQIWGTGELVPFLPRSLGAVQSG